MSPPLIERPALLVHTFWPLLDGRLPTSMITQWNAIALDHQIGDLPRDLTPEPVPEHRDRLVLLAARSGNPDGLPPPVRQALAYRWHDTVGVTVMLAPNRDDQNWSQLDGQWQGFGAEHPVDALGRAVIYLGILRGGPAPATVVEAAAVARSLHGTAPDPVNDAWTGAACGFADSIAVWPLPERPADGAASVRRLLALAPSTAEAAMDRWLWSPDAPGLPPLTHYLLHAAKLRYQRRVLLRDLPRLRRDMDLVNQASVTLAGALGDEALPVARLARTATTLAGLQAGTDGLIDSLARVRVMLRTVETARINLARILGAPRYDAAGSLLNADLDTAEWTVEQLHTELAYLQAATDRSGQLIAATRTVVDQGMQQHVDSRTLMQTSLIGGLLAALAAVQSLQYTVAVPGSLKAPLITALTVLVLWLPSAVLHWTRGARVSAGWRWLDLVLFSGLSATAGWLLASAVAQSAWDRPASVPVSALAAGCGAAMGLLLACLIRRSG